ncbi:hypothetical protein Aple_037900 [Acrocarpospora pleiomorpha]|uniref:Uncharacterized protein n=1 Tax=Acrocarpospora pleiomorpha TaxID=90975 RepID=A0A5M3XI51_9ACTN|nr:hypothetical protein [Acrocarpospora pleiomorpha]GES20894.1 hypothetical protein Aple_037900 [Acrocarpospora pleiomorpha]
MLDKLVVAHFFGQRQPLSLNRTPPLAPCAAVPAVLVIPREGPMHEPHLMVLTGPSAADHIDMAGVVADAHIVVDSDDARDRRWQELADVLITRHEVAGLLDRHVGCAVAVARQPGGCLVGLRHGPLAQITGIAGLLAGADPWPATFGSLLYCWLAARLPLYGLTTATVIAGHYRDGRHFEVAGRVRITVSEAAA